MDSYVNCSSTWYLPMEVTWENKWLSTYTRLTVLEGVSGSPPLDSQNDRSLDLGLTSARFHTPPR